MNYGMIKKYDIADGPGVRVSLFVSGCTHHCYECFQPETWDFAYGKEFTPAAEQEVLTALGQVYIQGLTLLGGEPFEPSNQEALVPFLKKVREAYPKKDIWAYSGYDMEELMGLETRTGRARCGVTDEMLSLIDVIVDGEFVQDLKDITLKFRGSSNQRILDVKKSLEQNQPVNFYKEADRRGGRFRAQS